MMNIWRRREWEIAVTLECNRPIAFMVASEMSLTKSLKPVCCERTQRQPFSKDDATVTSLRFGQILSDTVLLSTFCAYSLRYSRKAIGVPLSGLAKSFEIKTIVGWTEGAHAPELQIAILSVG